MSRSPRLGAKTKTRRTWGTRDWYSSLRPTTWYSCPAKMEARFLLIDSHAHLDSPRYAEDREAMLQRASDAGVGAVLSIGIGEGPAEMEQALGICREFNGKTGMPRL